jgi:hypothetical protein
MLVQLKDNTSEHSVFMRDIATLQKLRLENSFDLKIGHSQHAERALPSAIPRQANATSLFLYGHSDTQLN